MELELIFNGKATLEDLTSLNLLGYTFDIDNGCITAIYKNNQVVQQD